MLVLVPIIVCVSIPRLIRKRRFCIAMRVFLSDTVFVVFAVARVKFEVEISRGTTGQFSRMDFFGASNINNRYLNSGHDAELATVN